MAETLPKLARRLTTQDASFVYGESRSGPLHISSIGIFEGELKLEELMRHIERRLHLVPRYRQRLNFVPLNFNHATWEDAADFKLADHIRLHRLPDGTSEEDMIKAALKVNAPPLDFTRPLWEMHLFTGLAGGRSAMLTKVHHCMIDGVSGVELVTITMDFKPDAPPPPPPEKELLPVPAPGRSRSFVDAALDYAQSQINLARQLTESISGAARTLEQIRPLGSAALKALRLLARPIAPTPWSSAPVTRSRSLAQLKVSFAELRMIRSALGGTVNDVVLAILSEGAARYLKHHKVPTFGLPLRIGCPVNVRRENESGALGNRVSMMFPELRSTPMEAVARLRSVSVETERIKNSKEPQSLDGLMGGGDLIPPALMGLGSALATTVLDVASRVSEFVPWSKRLLPLPAIGINFIATNVPGVQVPLYVTGRRMESFIGLMPLAANMGYSVAIGSYNNDLYFGMMAETRVMPDVDLMKFCVKQTFEELKAVARKIKPIERRPRAEDGAAASAEGIQAAQAAGR